jgi:excisionase family DNA binding protein
VSLGKDNLTPAEVAQLTELSVHTLSYWRQSDQGPKTIKAGTRTLYRREDVEQWLAEVDGRSEPMGARKNARSDPMLRATSGWYEKAVEAAGRIEPTHTSPWKLASTYALLCIAESLLTRQQPRQPGLEPAGPVGQKHRELLTVAEVSEMTRLSVGTLRWWVGAGGPSSIKLGRRVMYRRADIGKWMEQAQ